ncbi:MAG TPA: hypothetical protein PK920_04915 [Phycisphaerae bacterium]|nr:hypothetical protein [Phycisphaerae bacterium]
MNVSKSAQELRRLFSGLVEQIFMAEVGICAPRLTDYLAQLLADFLHMDRVFRLRTADGELIREVSRMRAEAEIGMRLGDQTRARHINRYIGDFTLFWAGLYPESLQPRRNLGADLWRQYLVEGKTGYELASELSQTEDVPPPELLFDLSRQFESCVHGLHLVRENWEQLPNLS